jgi:hypothetical protein
MGEVTEYIAGLDEPARSVLDRFRAFDAIVRRRRDEIDAALAKPARR